MHELDKTGLEAAAMRARLDQAIHATEKARTDAEWNAAVATMNKQLDALEAVGLDRADEYDRACKTVKILTAQGA